MATHRLRPHLVMVDGLEALPAEDCAGDSEAVWAMTNKICENCRCWKYEGIVETPLAIPTMKVGRCELYLGRNLAADDYTCGEWQEKPDD